LTFGWVWFDRRGHQLVLGQPLTGRDGDCRTQKPPVERHRLVDQNRKAVDAGPEVDRLAGQVDLRSAPSLNMTQRSDDPTRSDRPALFERDISRSM
jgi:hypothetical protein